jgi:hypothetical protein
MALRTPLISETRRSEGLADAVRAISELPAGSTPSRELLTALRAGWGNESWSADVAYLEELAVRATETSGPILECGSGITTVLLSLLASRRGIEVWTLEHSPGWLLHVVAAMTQLELPAVNVRLCELRDYGPFAWYAPPPDLPMNLSLVVCDGPPGTTKGGRFGLWPVLGRHLAAGAVVLLDDANRKGEQGVLGQWLALSGGTSTTHGRFAVLVLPGTAPQTRRE